MNTNDLLLEIGTEELPYKSQQTLAQALAAQLEKGFKKAELAHGAIRIFSTPRRLAVLIQNLATLQPDQIIEKRGPALKAAYDSQGHPTLACIGFANSCGTSIDLLSVRDTEKGAWLFFHQPQRGAKVEQLLPALIQQAVNQLPLSKPMRWGNGSAEFIRPVHWVVLLFGEAIIPMQLFDIATGRETFGHRFHHPQAISIPTPNQYERLLQETGFVMADADRRKKEILSQAQKVVPEHSKLVEDDALLDEVTGLVEWPVALLGKFEASFLHVPSEAIMTAMKSHQKYFSIVDDTDQLKPYFVFISNIESKNPQQVIDGNQRVLRARLSDAQFFYDGDLKRNLEARLTDLESIIFQQKLGTLLEKSMRISMLMAFLANSLPGFSDICAAKRAGLLCKADLTTAMVGEFPELQGIMGDHYARPYETAEIALALREQYQPRFSKDALPQTPLGQLLSVADKIDTLVGFFSIQQIPTGEKDPYGLRRAALGVLRILIEKKIPLDLFGALKKSLELYAPQLPSHLQTDAVAKTVYAFMMERLRPWYMDQHIDAGVFSALWDTTEETAQHTMPIFKPLDFHRRILAVQHFLNLPQANPLIAANKRVKNLLKQAIDTGGVNADFLHHPASYAPIQISLFEHPAEQALYDAIQKKSAEITPLHMSANYTNTLTALAALQKPIDDFFEHVMVMVENQKALTQNRLNLLRELQQLFLQVADVSKLR